MTHSFVHCFPLILAVFSIFSASHAILHKRDSRAGFGWVVTCLVFVGIGPVLYWLFGINRIRTHAKKIYHIGYLSGSLKSMEKLKVKNKLKQKIARLKRYKAILEVSERVNRHPLTTGNKLKILLTGEEAYSEMLLSIRNARNYVCLCTYIFDSDETGKDFIKALVAAQKRGVKVFVLVDSVGELYSFPWIGQYLKKAGIIFSRFMPLTLSVNSLHFNLRNHRKLLVVDDVVGFMGGMNIRSRHLMISKNPIRDIHFKVEGPQVTELLNVFLEDWYFSTKQKLRLPSKSNVKTVGTTVCRVVCSGPNEDFENINWMLLSVLSWAKNSVRIMTPYFLPDRVLISVLNAAALRGISVEVILPIANNLAFVGWANRAILWEMIENGIKFYYQPAPFSHSKLLVVDDNYALIGSSNWDARSLRLNFELDLEVYDPAFAKELSRYFAQTLKRSKGILMDDLNKDPLLIRFRNSFCKLFLPYL
jgi:cardiolipin synthase